MDESKVRRIARALRSDGCTGVPDFTITDCCYEHDIYYRTHRRVGSEKSISRWRADWRLMRCIQRRGTWPEAIFVAPAYWIGVRLFAWWTLYSREPRTPQGPGEQQSP